MIMVLGIAFSIMMFWHERHWKLAYGVLLGSVLVLGFVIGYATNNLTYNIKSSDSYNFGEANGYNRGYDRGFIDGQKQSSDNLTLPRIDWSQFD